MRIDHFMYGVPSLEAAMDTIENKLGVRPVMGGSHVGMGTRNALLSLGDCYLEIIAPDPEQALSGTMGQRLEALTEGGLVTWAIEGDLSAVKATLRAQGIECRGPNVTKRAQPNGEEMIWQLLFPRSEPDLPFFIDWMACVNPAKTAPVGGAISSFAITTKNDNLTQMISSLGLNVGLDEGELQQTLVIQSAKGALKLTSTPESLMVLTG